MNGKDIPDMHLSTVNTSTLGTYCILFYFVSNLIPFVHIQMNSTAVYALVRLFLSF